jgi:hypothetical protein
MAESMIAIQIARWFVTKVSLPSLFTDASVRMILTDSMSTSCHRLTDITILSGPSIVADTFIGCEALAIGAVVATGDVTVCSFPSFITVAFKSILARPMITPWQWNANIAIWTLPSNFTSTVVWCPAVSMNTSQSIVVTDRFKARVEFCLSILNFWLFPSRLADYISLIVTNVPVGVFKIFRFAGMIINLQGCEPCSRGEIEQKKENHSSLG